MTPTAILALHFADGSVGRMQYFDEDTSDKRLDDEIAKSAFGQPVVSWERVRMQDFPTKGRDGWTKVGPDIVARNLPRQKTEVDLIKERLDALEASRVQLEP